MGNNSQQGDQTSFQSEAERWFSTIRDYLIAEHKSCLILQLKITKSCQHLEANTTFMGKGEREEKPLLAFQIQTTVGTLANSQNM